ncbi:MAG: hypothetical protein WDA12_02685 [Bacilli bacterium]
MKESVSNAFLFNWVIFFLAIIIAILIGSLSYSKTYRVKNKIVGIIEKHQDYNSSARNEIDQFLKEIGYKTNPKGGTKCPTGHGSLLNAYNSNYHYCVYYNSDWKGYHFTVIAFMYFEIPVIGDFLELPVYGDTKVIYDI